MQQGHIGLLEKWLEDPSFHNWAKQENTDDYRQWEAWLATHPEQLELALLAAQIARGIKFQEIPLDPHQSAKALEQLQQRLAMAKQSPLGDAKVKAVPARRFLARYRIRIAAAVALLICAGIFAYHQMTADAYVIVQTGFGEQKELSLPDQTKVVLNANSTLRYAEQNPRNVWLKGEAFFEVKKKPKTNEKFLVYTDDMDIEVLGTAFNVSNRDSQTEVFLEEGKVKLSLKDEEKSGIMLAPGDLLTYSAKHKGQYEKKHSETSLHTSWKNGVLILKATPLREVITQMEDIYGVKITLQHDTLGQHKITMAIPLESLPIALATIENALGMDINQQDKHHYMISNRTK